MQECVVPDIIVELGHRDHGAEIVKVDWKGMRCRVSVKTEAKGLTVDLRLKRNDPKSIATEAKTVPESGDVTLIVEDDSHEGSGAVRWFWSGRQSAALRRDDRRRSVMSIVIG